MTNLWIPQSSSLNMKSWSHLLHKSDSCISPLIIRLQQLCMFLVLQQKITCILNICMSIHCTAGSCPRMHCHSSWKTQTQYSWQPGTLPVLYLIMYTRLPKSQAVETQCGTVSILVTPINAMVVVTNAVAASRIRWPACNLSNVPPTAVLLKSNGPSAEAVCTAAVGAVGSWGASSAPINGGISAEVNSTQTTCCKCPSH